MADFNNESNGVFGGVSFEGTNNGGTNENTSYFEGNVQNVENAGVFGSFETVSNAGSYNGTVGNGTEFQPIAQEKAITKQGLWSKIRSFLFQEIDLNAPIKVELTPAQQKVEDEINEFLYQEITFKGITNFFKGNK